MGETYNLESAPNRKAPTSTPKYRVVTSTDRISVTKGQKATFSVYLTGYGEIERHKLTIFMDKEPLLTPEGGTLSIPFANDDDGITFGAPALKKESQFVHKIDKNSSTVYLSNLLFLDSPAFEFPPEPSANDWVYPTIIAEGDWGEHAPIEIELPINENAKPGDYNFQIFFTYSDRLEAYQSKSQVEIHVQSKVEEYEPWPQRFAILGAMIALISLIYQTGIFDVALNTIENLEMIPNIL